jgi:hypothetical protein
MSASSNLFPRYDDHVFARSVELYDAHQRGIVASVRNTLSQLKRSHPGAQPIWAALAAELRPETLFHEEVRSNPVIYRQLLSLVEETHGKRIQDSPLLRTQEALNGRLYVDDDYGLAITILNSLTGNQKPAVGQSWDGISSENVRPPESDSKVAQSVAIRFKDDKKKNPGAIDDSSIALEAFSELIKEFAYAPDEMQMTGIQKLKLLPPLLRDDAKIFYGNHVAGRARTYQGAEALIEKE